jgi:hypothetical protein
LAPKAREKNDMPVNRLRTDVRTRYDEGARVVPGQRSVGSFGGEVTPVVKAAKEQLTMLSQVASTYAQGLAAAAEDEARALAKAAVFSTDESGMPQVDDSARNRMGKLGRRVYDGQLEDRYAYQMKNAMQAQLGSIYNQHLNDPEGYAAAAAERIDELRQSVPDHLQGMFQQISESMIVDHSVKLGHAAAVLEQRNVAEMAPAQNGDVIGVIREQIIAGVSDENIDAMVADQLMFIQNLPPHITAAQRIKMQDELYQAVTTQRFLRDNVSDEMSSNDLLKLREELINFDNPAVMEWFADQNGGGAPRRDWADAAGRALWATIQAKQLEEQRMQAGRVEVQATEDLMLGRHENNPKGRALLDGVLGQAMGLKTEAGGYRPLQPEDWLQMSPEQRSTAIQNIKMAGFPPDSLVKLLRQAERNLNNEAFAELMPLLHDIENAPAASGATIDFSEHMGPRTATIYQTAKDLAEGATPNAEDIAIATSMADVAMESDWSTKHLRDAILTEQAFETTGPFSRRRVTEENAEAVWRSMVVSGVFGNEEAYEEDRDKAVRIATMYLRVHNSPSKAVDAARQIMEQGTVPTIYMGNTQRSRGAPEKFYDVEYASEDMPEDFGVNLGNVSAPSRLGDLLSYPTRLAMALAGYPDTFQKDVNGNPNDPAFKNASVFDRIADKQIREHIQGLDDATLKEQLMYGGNNALFHEPFFEPGTDYVLEPDWSTGERPTYKVIMQRNGMRIPIPGFRVDPREEIDAIRQHKERIDTVRMLATRAEQIVIEQGYQFRDDFYPELMEVIQNGNQEQFNALMMQLEKYPMLFVKEPGQ